MTGNTPRPAQADYWTWFRTPPGKDWHVKGTGYKIKAAYLAGWVAGAAYLATAIRDEHGSGYLPEVMVDELLGLADSEAPPGQ